MATYTCFAELQGNLLQYKDHVIFNYNGFSNGHRVGIWTLSKFSGSRDNENEIFKRLGLDPWKFCKQHYTKVPENWERDQRNFPNFWPEYITDDFKSATKVVLELFKLIEENRQLKETSEILFID